MERSELYHIIAAIAVLWVVISISLIYKLGFGILWTSLFFAIIIIAINILAKKGVAYLLDSNVEHSIWMSYRFGFKPRQHYKKERPFGIIFPIVLSFLSLGFLKIMTILTYETSALKTRASRRFGHYSFTEMTDFHNGLIGTAGIVSTLILSAVIYSTAGSSVIEYFARVTAYYAFFNILPISKLDGTQIFFGSKVIWIVLATICTIFALYGVLSGLSYI